MNRHDLKNKIWNICDILKDDGMHISTYIEQLTILLFLKMFEDREGYFSGKRIEIPEEYSWKSLKEKRGEELLHHYNEEVIPALARQDGIIGEIFARLSSHFRTPVALKNAIKKIDKIDWNSVNADVKGAAYESLLARYAEKAEGAGQYFTPREVIDAIVKVTDPKVGEKIHDPAAGTGGFLVQAYEHILSKTNDGADLTREERKNLMTKHLSGRELVPETRRLGLMNLALRDLQPENFEIGNSLAPGSYEKDKYDLILTNPPYGGNGNKKPAREDFMIDTKSPELNFIQHVMSALKPGGRCGMVVPDGVLFQTGAAKRVRKELFENFNLHTILILPVGAFQPYTGITTNVIFFEKGESTEEVWYYDLRTKIEKIKKSNPLTEDLFKGFVENFGNRERGAVRLSIGAFNSASEIEQTLHSIEKISEKIR